MSISHNLQAISQTIPTGIRLIAVSKTRTEAEIMEAYAIGQRDFGENKPQELVAKAQSLPPDIRWHLIGHLQTNKVKMVLPYVHLIHAVDSLRLLSQINKEAVLLGKQIDCLLQFHIAREESKFGLTIDEAIEILHSEDYKSMDHIRICGVMGMATFTSNQELIRQEFKSLQSHFIELKQTYFPKADYFAEISMGMSDDYRIAIEEGSSMVRVGSAIFGVR